MAAASTTAAKTTAAAKTAKPAATKAAAKPAESKQLEPKDLTLQQKMVEIRKMIPSIAKGNTSEGVKYKFAKIDDVYRFLGPALNEWRVNLQIIEEEATRHAENGDGIYWTTYTQNTYKGARTVFVWEEDLTISWINADNPNETIDVTLHATGTNDGGPDKAKGSALTYCLKYYFFEIFAIDQGDEDPDQEDHGTEAAPQQPRTNSAGASQNASNSTHTDAGGRNTPPQQTNGSTGQNSSSKRLTEGQLNRMYRKAEDAGLTKEGTDARILKYFGVSDPAALTRQQYDDICNQMDAAIRGSVSQQPQGGQP